MVIVANCTIEHHPVLVLKPVLTVESIASTITITAMFVFVRQQNLSVVTSDASSQATKRAFVQGGCIFLRMKKMFFFMLTKQQPRQKS
jgi:hypothetical protein